jgi:hypothetical protein
MRLIAERSGAIDLTITPVHLGLGSRALPVEGFSWDLVADYGVAVADDGPERRMVMIARLPVDSTYESHGCVISERSV